jgi:hypothetical protein
VRLKWFDQAVELLENAARSLSAISPTVAGLLLAYALVSQYGLAAASVRQMLSKFVTQINL